MPNRLWAALLLGITITGARDAAAQETDNAAPAPKVEVSGLFDFYTLFQFRNPPSGSLLGPGRLYYDIQHAEPTLALAEVNASLAPQPGGWGFKATLMAGDVADINHGAAPVSSGELGGLDTPEGRLRNIQQLYASYQTRGGYTVDLGKFYTPIGLEVTEATANMNYSHSQLYSITPVYHAGVRASTPSMNGLTVTAAVVNALYNTTRAGVNDDNDAKALILQALYAKGAVTASTGLGWGKERLNGVDDQDSLFWDGWVSYAATPATTLVLNLDYRKDEDSDTSPSTRYTGLALYAKQALNEKQSAALRYSTMRAKTDGFETAAVKTSPWEVTATFEHRFTPSFATRVEYRHDDADGPSFPDGDGDFSRDTQDTLLVAGLFTF